MLADVVVHPEPIPSVLVLGLLNPGELVQPSRAFCSTSLGISTFLSSGSVVVYLGQRFEDLLRLGEFGSYRLGQL